MSAKKKKSTSSFKVLLLIGFVLVMLYLSMKDTYQEVLTSLSRLRWYDILILVIASASMYILSGMILYHLAKKSNSDYKRIDAIRDSFITMFASNL